MNSSEKSSPAGSEVAAGVDLEFLGRFLTFVRRDKILFAACGVAAIVLAAIWMRVATPTYQAEMTLLPNPNESSSSNSSKASSLGSLLDFGFGGGESPNFVKFVDTLKSFRLAKRLEERHQYLQRIYPYLWNEAEKKWAPRKSVIAVFRWIFLGQEIKAPNITSLQDFIRVHMTVDEDKKNHSLVIKLQSRDPLLAVSLLRDIQEEADGLLREDSRNYTQHAVDYLESTLRGITAEDHHRALTSLLIEYERALILVSDKDEAFASIVVDPPTLSSVPVSPKATFIYPGFLLVAGLIATGAATRRTRRLSAATR